MFSETSKCLNCPEQVTRSTENPHWHHANDEDYEWRYCKNPYLSPKPDGKMNVAEPDEYSQYLGRAVIVSAGSMAYYGVLRALSPGALVIITRGETPVPVPRPNVQNVREINEPEKVGLRHDGVTTSHLYPQKAR